MDAQSALVIIDVQNDFCEGGNLAVPEGGQVVPVINRLSEKFFNQIITQDWHPQNHSSFASSHQGQDPFSVIEVDYGPQVLWPEHCIQGTSGAEFHKDLQIDKANLIIRKGFHQQIDSYSAFVENDKKTATGLASYLQERGIKKLFMTGLATDFCVNFSAVDAADKGFDTTVIIDACRAINMDGSLDAAMSLMQDKGVKIIESSAL